MQVVHSQARNSDELTPPAARQKEVITASCLGHRPALALAKRLDRERASENGVCLDMRLPRALHRHWTAFKRGHPGRRFQDRYNRTAQDRRGHLWFRALKIVAAIVVIGVGLFEVVFPGPASVFLVAGGALLATESRTAARFMDWSEMRVREAYRTAHDWWHRSHPMRRAH